MSTAKAPRAVKADENATPMRSVPARSASPQRKKVLGERNSGGSGSRGDGASPQPKPAPSPTPASPTGRAAGAGPYDPKTNCSTPRLPTPDPYPRPSFPALSTTARLTLAVGFVTVAAAVPRRCSPESSHDAALQPVVAALSSTTSGSHRAPRKATLCVPQREAHMARFLVPGSGPQEVHGFFSRVCQEPCFDQVISIRYSAALLIVILIDFFIEI